MANRWDHFEATNGKTSYESIDRAQIRDKLKLSLFAALL